MSTDKVLGLTHIVFYVQCYEIRKKSISLFVHEVNEPTIFISNIYNRLDKISLVIITRRRLTSILKLERHIA